MSKNIPAFTVHRVAGGWSFIKLEIDPKSMKVVSKTVSEPDTKPIITERFKIEVGKYWGKLDEQTIA
jgi:hypothetical protein